MSTIKFVAIGPQSSGYQKFPVVDAAGNRYSPTWGQSYKDQLEVGSKAFLGKRINNPHGENAIWELWPITIDLTTAAKAAAAMTAIDTAVGTVSTNQSTIGAQQNLLKDAASYVDVVSSNTKSAISNIEDLNVAEASTQLTLLQTQQQLATSVLSIINQLPSYALKLIQ